MTGPSDMTVFVRVVDEGGFTAAARSLGLTPSAVSKIISRLEDRLNTRLLQRTTRKLSLTHEGVVYYQRSTAILGEIAETEQTISEFNSAPRGTLTVTTSVAFAAAQIVPIMPEFLETYPEVGLQLIVTDRVSDLIEDGIDVAVRVGVQADSSLISRLLAEDYRILCAAPGYIERHGIPQTPADLAHHTCLAWHRNHNNLNDWPLTGPGGEDIVWTAMSNIEADNGETLYEMTLAGLGIARLAEFRVGDDIKAGRLAPILTRYNRPQAVPVHAIYPHRRHLLPRVRAFVDFLVNKFSPVPPWRVRTD